MCKPSCCSGNSGGGLGVLAVIAAAVFIALIAGPAIHEAGIFFRMAVEIAAITLASVAGIAVIAVAIVMTVRKTRSQRHAASRVVNRRMLGILPVAYIATDELKSAFEAASLAQAAGQLPALRNHLRLVPHSIKTIQPTTHSHQRRWP